MARPGARSDGESMPLASRRPLPTMPAMRMVADLHLHSHYSRATSRDLTLASLHRAALLKGISLVGTGDFTHPGWRAEIEEQLEEAEPGLFRLIPEIRRQVERDLPPACRGEVRFVLQVEISNIYKKDGRTRKNHNLVFAPTLEVARAISERLAAIGNVASDGRPILGLDARDLLEITLEADPRAFLIPAHVWTPWFSMLGSKSGFDSVEECFGDLASEVFAAETGLSSDPPMNWRLSQLDRLTLVSSSDAHSAGKLGREANLLDIEPGYEPLRQALRTREGFLGTIEFFPEEGKYHLDGHRKCDLRLEPEQTRELGGRCPRCGEKLTVGVLSRVADLADRPSGYRPEGAADFVSLVPLAEVVAEVCGVGPGSKQVRGMVDRLHRDVGAELGLLREAPLEDLRRVGGEPLAEAVRRMRAGELAIDAGYDGQFGTVRIFAPGERDHLAGQMAFAGASYAAAQRRASPAGAPSIGADSGAEQGPAGGSPIPSLAAHRPPAHPTAETVTTVDALAGLDDQQRQAAEAEGTPLLVVAGPGAGKTRTLVARLVHRIRSGRVHPDRMLAVTFTNQAADELRQRARAALPESGGGAPTISTFHGFGRRLLEELVGSDRQLLDDEQRLQVVRAARDRTQRKASAAQCLRRLSLAKQSCNPLEALASEPGALSLYQCYQQLLEQQRVCDVDDLVLVPYLELARDPEKAAAIARRFDSLLVDEYQDVNDVQAALVHLLAGDGSGLCAIGDPDQAIYGFRGSRPQHFSDFAQVYPSARVVRLSMSYRLTQPVLGVARSVLTRPRPLVARAGGPPVELVECPTPASEAEQIVVRLERLVGGTSLFAVDSGRGGDAEALDVGFGDVAVLTRTKHQQAPLVEALGRSGIPCHAVAEEEPHDPRSQKVALMTMHAAKGREFEVVFVAGVERGLVPLELEGLECEPEEERRVLYVAITRARRLAVLSYTHKRSMFGRALPAGPSPLLDRLPRGAVNRSSAVLSGAGRRSRQLGLFD